MQISTMMIANQEAMETNEEEEMETEEDLICNQCNVPFYVPDDESYECLKNIPQGTDIVLVPDFENECTWEHLAQMIESPAAQTIKVIHLGHDGVIFASRAHLKYSTTCTLDSAPQDDSMDEAWILKTISGLPNLQAVIYCGYHTDYHVPEAKTPLINWIELL